MLLFMPGQIFAVINIPTFTVYTFKNLLLAPKIN